jgi:type II secretory pathway component GspD/PulD (secretin)
MEGEITMKKSILIALFIAIAIFLVSVKASLPQETKAKMRQEIVKLKSIKSDDVLSGGILFTFLSPQGRINSNPEARMITVSDYPENVEKILALIREIDVKPADIQFAIQLVLGSAASEEKSEENLQNDPVIKELRSLLNYKSFTMLDTSLVRAIDREYSQVTMGTDAELQLELRPKYIKEEKEDLIQVVVQLKKMQQIIEKGQASSSSTILLTSNFTMKSGEKTVVGVSKMDGGDKGLILIISGKVIK